MKNLIRFLVLVLCGLILSSYSYDNRESVDPNDKDIFIKGKLSFEDKSLPTIKFWVEGDAGYYSIIMFQEDGLMTNHLIETVEIVSNIMKSKICSSSEYIIFNNKYFIINFTNKEILKIKGLKLFALGFKIVKETENQTSGHVSGYISL